MDFIIDFVLISYGETGSEILFSCQRECAQYGGAYKIEKSKISS